jgi:hypothetical protein
VIPRILHYVWLGPRPFPEIFRIWQDKAMKLHPNYELNFVRETSAFPDRIQTLLGKCANYSEQSDVLRYHLLETRGGIWLDTDVEVYRPFYEDALIYPHAAWVSGYYCGFTKGLLALPAVMGSVPGSAFAVRCMDLVERFADMDARSDIKFGRITQKVWEAGDVPMYVTHPSWFFPFGYQESPVVGVGYGSHHWSGTWAAGHDPGELTRWVSDPLRNPELRAG